MNNVETLRQEILAVAPGSSALQSRLATFEVAVRAEERANTLAPIRHRLNTLRSLVSFLRQEVAACAGPLESLCDELEREVDGGTRGGR